MFISDCDKGLKPALCRVFPGNLAVRCAKHIQANVKAKFGQLCARYVIQLAETFSARISDDLLDEIRNIKLEAADYIESVEDVWRSTERMDSRRNLPPHYGIVTYNTSKCVKKEQLVRLRLLKGKAISLVSILRKLHVSMVVTRYQCMTSAAGRNFGRLRPAFYASAGRGHGQAATFLSWLRPVCSGVRSV